MNRSKLQCVCILAAGLIFSQRAVRAADTVVAAGPREPADEARAFHLPPGFEVQLVASEPQIHKPINIAFDDRGRLWVTDTVEYPFPAPDNRTTKTRDTLKILEDFGDDGHARKVTTFADDLNIPIGILPRGDSGAIVYSIPAVWQMSDPQHTGAATERKILLTGQGHKDTHGMTGSFLEGCDGWIYAVHGFSNDSDIKGTDASQIHLNSGNTYRFRPDGSHVQAYTHGQVNPFGLCTDALGNLFTSDCETKPIALLLHEAYYPSFGKPDDGLGFAPEMVDHMYGSTAIAGLCNYAADAFPPEYRGMMLVGNVVTNRINRCDLSARGSGYHGDDRPDLLASDDAWFRPVNIKLGPDGALYVADFYNRIIGHYEVDLHHPGRDKERGRIWRIVYKGDGSTTAPSHEMPDLTKLSNDQLVRELGNANLTVRTLAMNRLADTIGAPAVDAVKAAVAHPTNAWQKAHALWVLQRLGELDQQTLAGAASDPDIAVRVHAMRILGNTTPLDDAHRQLLLQGLKDAAPIVARVAAESLESEPTLNDLRPLLDARERAMSSHDAFLLHTVRICMRDHLLKADTTNFASAGFGREQIAALADVAVGIPTPAAATVVFDAIHNDPSIQGETLIKSMRHVARYLPAERSDELAALIPTRFASDPTLQIELFEAMSAGIAERGATPTQATRDAAAKLAERVLTAPQGTSSWSEQPLPGNAFWHWSWDLAPRACADGHNTSVFFTSSETSTGILKSQAFAVPPALSFWLAGHNGQPPSTPAPKNFIRLRAVDNGEVLAEALPPRNDTAQRVQWDLNKFAGRQAYLEATDGDDATGYAWLAFGRLEPAVVPMPSALPKDRQQQLARVIRLVAGMKLTATANTLRTLLVTSDADADTRVEAARTLGAIDPDASVAAFTHALDDGAAPEPVREAAGASLGQTHSPEAVTALVSTMRSAPQRLQLSLAKSLASTPAGAEALLTAVSAGQASPRLLQDANVRERLATSHPNNLDQRVAQLTAKLPPTDAQVQKLIDQRAAGFNAQTASVDRGTLVFQKNCMVCHRINGQGAQVGPQLDGIGIRGVARLSEDVLDPSRNVDAAFRYTTFVLKNGDALAGLVRREEGQSIIIADATGKEVAIDKTQVARSAVSNLSLMPSNFAEILPPDAFNDLMAYLLTTNAK